jgi:2-polyprenyl-6-methoxyphenol hydroxylase-like FAD-dependent oxidoreductase
MMKVVIVGAGIGGLATALALHALGIKPEVYEQARELRELGVGINMLPHAIKELAALGLLPALDQAGIRTRALIYANRFGQTVWQELRGIDAGYDTPQFSIHRGKLHGVLLRAALERLGGHRIHTGCRLESFRDDGESVIAGFEDRTTNRSLETDADALIGADGIHSKVRARLYPEEGAPIWNGIMLWRGALDWPVYGDGRTMMIAGGNDAKFVLYPIHADPARPELRLTNWAVMARTADGTQPPPRREDWNRPGELGEVLPFVRYRFRLGFIEPAALIAATGTIYEYPCCDRDPLTRWSFGRVTLLGDAAHPMYPVGSNGASQAILDARALARHLASGRAVPEALAAYDAERRLPTAQIVLSNRKGGPERVIDLVEARAPEGFNNIEDIASHSEREAVVRGYAAMAGYARDQVNAAESRSEDTKVESGPSRDETSPGRRKRGG